MRVLLLCLLASAVVAQPAPVLGGGTAEWDARTPAAMDPVGDATAGADLTTLWADSDAEYLYIAFEVTSPLLLIDGSGLTLSLDADDDPSTGIATSGLGAELIWRFGEREGTVASGARIEWAEVGLWAAPQVTATRFEVALPRQPAPGVRDLFDGPTVRLRVSSAGDAVTAGVTLSDAPRERSAVSLDPTPGHVRVLAYNVLRSNLLLSGAVEAGFGRVLRAVGPDIAVITEIYDASGPQTAARLATLLGEPVSDWYGAKAGPDVVVAARTPVAVIQEVDGNGLFRVTSPQGGPDWIVAGLHPPCCTNDDGRQEEVDAMIAAIRDRRADGTIPADAPLVVAGDMNFVGDARQLATLFEGDILDEGRFGPDAPPDLDGTPLAVSPAPATGLPTLFTWRNVGSSFTPGRLDYLAYSDAALTAGREFVLYTPGLTGAELDALGLERNDAAGRDPSGTITSDHLPVVVDLAERTSTSMSDAPAGDGVEIVRVVPHPIRSTASLEVRTSSAGNANISLYDVLGRQARTWTLEVAAGVSAVPLDASGLAAGVYVARVQTPAGVVSRRLTIAR
ncbi:MAG: T9SS type A sorting domain-containing protein [Bacteroidota bacterium]